MIGGLVGGGGIAIAARGARVVAVGCGYVGNLGGFACWGYGELRPVGGRPRWPRPSMEGNCVGRLCFCFDLVSWAPLLGPRSRESTERLTEIGFVPARPNRCGGVTNWTRLATNNESGRRVQVQYVVMYPLEAL
eukprot:2493534-Pyramimonas_sp.AAC.1